MPKHHDQPGEHAALLVLALLSVESSYLTNEERPAGEVPDTIQFWMGPDSLWRIRTYAIDHDIHIYSLGGLEGEFDYPGQPCVEHIEKHYGDIYTSIRIVDFPDCTDSAAIKARLVRAGLDGKLEIAPAGFAFYNPDWAKYKSQSTPKFSEE